MKDDFDWGAALEPEAEVPKEAPKTPEVLLPATPDFDTREAALAVIPYEKIVAEMKKQAGAITIIKDDTTNELATEMALQAKKLWKKLEELRKDLVDPHNKYTKSVNNFFHRVQDMLLEIEKTKGRQQAAYRGLLENERRKREAAEAAERQRLQEELDKQAAEDAKKGETYTPVTVQAPVVQEAPKVTRTEEGSASQARRWVCEIVSAGLVPREHCLPVQKLLDDAVKAGVREIPGCRIFLDFQTKYRGA